MLLLSLFLFISLAFQVVYAEDEVNLTNLPTYLAEQLGVPEFAGQILASIIVLCLIMFPTFLLTRNPIAQLVMGFVSLGLVTAIGWLPYWFMLIISLVTAAMFAGLIRGWISGGSTKGD